MELSFITIIISVMEFGHLLTRSGLTYPGVSSKVRHVVSRSVETLRYKPEGRGFDSG